MSATEKIRREKWIDEKTKKIKEITVKGNLGLNMLKKEKFVNLTPDRPHDPASRPPVGLEPEIQKLISKHKQELKKLRMLHEAELLQADKRAAQRYVRQCDEVRQQLEREKEEQCQRDRELAKQRWVTWSSPPPQQERQMLPCTTLTSACSHVSNTFRGSLQIWHKHQLDLMRKVKGRCELTKHVLIVLIFQIEKVKGGKARHQEEPPRYPGN